MRHTAQLAKAGRARRQGGWLLIQLAFVMVVLSILAGQDLVKQFNAAGDVRAAAVATGIDVIRRSADDYVASYDDKLQQLALNAGGMMDTVAIVNAFQPTVEDLRQLGKAPFGATGKSLIAGGDYRIFITPNPTACVLPSMPNTTGARCNLDGLVCINKPMRTRGGVVDFPRAGLAIRRIGADGGYSTVATPGVISGLGGGWSTPNPIVPAVPGIVCARFGYSSSKFAPFLRKDGSVWMENVFNVGGHSIHNVKDVDGSGNIKGAEFLSDIKVAGAPCTDLGAIGSGNGYAMVCDGTAWQKEGERVTAGSDCTFDGITATSSATGEQLVCKNLKFVRLISLISKNVLVATALVQDGTVVAMPTCDILGKPTFSFDATQVTLDLTTNPPKQTMYWNAVVASPTTWRVNIRLKDHASGEVSGNTVGLTNIMNLECSY